jgi:hypothetical protein
MNEEVKPRVNVTVEVADAKTGQVLETQETHNLVVDAGLNLIRDALQLGTVSPITRIGLGTSGTAVNASDTALLGEIAKYTLLSITPSNKTLTCQYFLDGSTANGQTIRELGLFTDDGTMYARVLLDTPIPKTDLKVASMTWTLDWGSV